LNLPGVVAAFAAEARALDPRVKRGLCALPDGTLVAVSGMGRGAALSAAQRLIEAGATALVSWGMAGGLDPRLVAGAVCLPCEVIDADGTRYRTTRPWRDALAAALASMGAVAGGPLLTSERPIDSLAGKATAYRETGAVAVDMESAAVARAAAVQRLPFIAVRAIVDTAQDAVPRAITAATLTGQVRIAPLMKALVRSPADIAPLLRLARRYRAAMRSLSAVAGLEQLAPPAGLTAGITRTAS
jgi:adenosylhomocysteine nucleosidase